MVNLKFAKNCNLPGIAFRRNINTYSRKESVSLPSCFWCQLSLNTRTSNESSERALLSSIIYLFILFKKNNLTISIIYLCFPKNSKALFIFMFAISYLIFKCYGMFKRNAHMELCHDRLLCLSSTCYIDTKLILKFRQFHYLQRTP